MADYSYIGAGKVLIREAGAAAPLLEVGNCSSLNFAVAEESKELKDFTKGGGGLYNSVKRISSVDLAMTLHDLNSANAAMALYGNANAVAAASVSNEVLTGYKGGLSVTASMIDTAQTKTLVPVNGAATARANTTPYALNAYMTPATANGYYYKCTVAGTSAGAPPAFGTTIGGTTTDGTATWTNMGKTTLAVDTDYTVSAAGFTFTEAAGITDGETFNAGYTKEAGWAIESLLNSAKDYELVFDGLNEARSGKPVRVHVYKVKISPTQGLPLIGEEYLALELSGKVTKDSTKNGTTISQYFKVDIAS